MVKKTKNIFIAFNLIVILILYLFIGIVLVINLDNPHMASFSRDQTKLRVIFCCSFLLLLAFGASLLLAKFALRPIEKAWKKQLAFTADASHELRTPLAVIQSSLEIAMDNKEETIESQREWLENISYEQKRMAKLVEDLLTLSRGDANEQTLFKEHFFANELLEQIKQEFLPLAQKKGIELKTNAAPSLIMEADRKRMEQLLGIFVDNAIKYMGRPGTISLIATLRKEGLTRKPVITLSVADTGTGIPKEKLPYLFDRFYRADPSRTEEGSGLGLAIAKWIVERHNGRLQVDSEVGTGTRFTIDLPQPSPVSRNVPSN